MLDDLKLIHDRDREDALGFAEKQWQQLTYVYDINLQATDILNIVFAGMGGSALSALISKSWPGYMVPFEICRDYDVPAYVGEKTLFIASSYSGNTEETISSLRGAENKGAIIVVLTSGGELQRIANEKNYPLLLLPKAPQPRFGVFYSLKALITVLEKYGIVASESAEKSLHETSDFLKQQIASWLPTIPTENNPAKKLALEMMGKSPVVYAGPKLYPVAYKWKINFNENSKNVAWSGQLPEFNHNEFLGWTSHPVDKPYAVVDIRSNMEHERVQKRFAVTERLLSGKRPRTHVVDAVGDSLLEQLLSTIVFGDFVSLYLAILNGLNPTPVELIEKFKKSLDD